MPSKSKSTSVSKPSIPSSVKRLRDLPSIYSYGDDNGSASASSSSSSSSEEETYYHEPLGSNRKPSPLHALYQKHPVLSSSHYAILKSIRLLKECVVNLSHYYGEHFHVLLESHVRKSRHLTYPDKTILDKYKTMSFWLLKLLRSASVLNAATATSRVPLRNVLRRVDKVKDAFLSYMNMYKMDYVHMFNPCPGKSETERRKDDLDHLKKMSDAVDRELETVSEQVDAIKYEKRNMDHFRSETWPRT